MLTIFVLLLCTFIHTNAQNKIVYQYEIHDEIGPSVNRLTQKAIAEAEKINAAYILIDMDSYGGLVDDADAIRTALLKTKTPTLVFIRNNAASAGALISIACDSIYMMPGATIGAACVVNQEGEMMPEKYQSYMRKKLGATAEETGRDPRIAEGMADENSEIDSIKAKGKIITFTTDEALKYGYCNAKLEQPEAILPLLTGGPYVMVKHESSFAERVVLWLVNPAISGVFLLLIFGGIYFEFKAPGTFLPIGVSLVAAMFYFAPLYFEGLAANWEILVFGLGIILIVVEIFVLPGFGVAGISGIVLTILGLTLALVRNINFDFSFVAGSALAYSFLLVTLTMATPLVFILLFGQQIFASSIFKNMSSVTEMNKQDGYTIKDNQLEALIGLSAVCVTDLRPSGKIEINSEQFQAITEDGFIPKKSPVKVTAIRLNYLIVELV
ncbi:MAG: nodulation protein NfeD [Chitinophagales bacterium]|nr:nodulation protein NfeD [Chitinophagales bacterium]